jgi:hypothetical protein
VIALSKNDNATTSIHKIGLKKWLTKLKGLESIQELQSKLLLSKEAAKLDDNLSKIKIMKDEVLGLATHYHFETTTSKSKNALLTMLPLSFEKGLCFLDQYATLINATLHTTLTRKMTCKREKMDAGMKTSNCSKPKKGGGVIICFVTMAAKVLIYDYGSESVGL